MNKNNRDRKKRLNKDRKRQLRINTSIKKRLFKNIFVKPCCYCKVVFLIDELTVEHIVPLSFGGTNEDNNIALACAPCNHEKGRESWFLRREIRKEKYEQYSSQHFS